MSERGIDSDQVLTQMNYANYHGLIAKWGVELAGWTEEVVVNPCKIQMVAALKRLLNALRKGHCYWQALLKAEWDQKIEEQESAEPRSRKRCCDHGMRRAPKSRKVSKNQTASSRASSSLDNSDNTSSGDEEQQDEQDEQEEEEEE